MPYLVATEISTGKFSSLLKSWQTGLDFCELQKRATPALRRLGDRAVWMVSSTARRGGVAEHLFSFVTVLRRLGVNVQWLVIESDDSLFIDSAKSLYRSLLGEDDRSFNAEAIYHLESTNRRVAQFIEDNAPANSILVVHDHQPVHVAAMLKLNRPSLRTIWRCHTGSELTTSPQNSAWEFLAGPLSAYERIVFSVPESVPGFLRGKTSIIPPGIWPESLKNIALGPERASTVLTGDDSEAAKRFGPFPGLGRLRPNGIFTKTNIVDELGLLRVPTVCQISRWDRMKGFPELMRAFVDFSEKMRFAGAVSNQRSGRFLNDAHLLLAGPDNLDSEACEVIENLRSSYASLDKDIQARIAIVTLPVRSRQWNALLVNALQTSSTILVQNSLQEGFGLTLTEAMWKKVPVLSNSRSLGPRFQIRNSVEGILIRDPQDTVELSNAIEAMLRSERLAELGEAGHRRVKENFLVFDEIQKWLELFASS